MLSSIKYVLLGFLFSTLFITGPWVYYKTNLFKEEPYNVTSVSYELSGNDLYINSNFTKSHCEFSKLDVFGNYLGEWFLIPWVNTLEDDFTGDRTEGEHTLRITASPIDKQYDTVQVRTRHICGSNDPKTVGDDRYFLDKIMVTIDLTGG